MTRSAVIFTLPPKSHPDAIQSNFSENTFNVNTPTTATHARLHHQALHLENYHNAGYYRCKELNLKRSASPPHAHQSPFPRMTFTAGYDRAAQSLGCQTGFSWQIRCFRLNG